MSHDTTALTEESRDFVELYNRYIHLATRGVDGMEEAYVWIKANFRTEFGMKMKYVGKHAVAKLEPRLTVAKMNPWHPFALLFESIRLHENNIMPILSTAMNSDPEYVMRHTAMLLISQAQFQTVVDCILGLKVRKVAPGETLEAIAKQYNTTVKDLFQKNPEITNPDRLYAGHMLRLF